MQEMSNPFILVSYRRSFEWKLIQQKTDAAAGIFVCFELKTTPMYTGESCSASTPNTPYYIRPFPLGSNILCQNLQCKTDPKLTGVCRNIQIDLSGLWNRPVLTSIQLYWTKLSCGTAAANMAIMTSKPSFKATASQITSQQVNDNRMNSLSCI